MKDHEEIHTKDIYITNIEKCRKYWDYGQV